MVILEFNNGVIVEGSKEERYIDFNAPFSKSLTEFELVIGDERIPLSGRTLVGEYKFFEGMTLDDIHIAAKVRKFEPKEVYRAIDSSLQIKQELTVDEYNSLDKGTHKYYEKDVNYDEIICDVKIDIFGKVIEGPVENAFDDTTSASLGFEIVDKIDLDFKETEFKWEKYMEPSELGSDVLEAIMPVKIHFNLLHDLVSKAFKAHKFRPIEHEENPISKTHTIVKFNQPHNERRSIFVKSLFHNVNVYDENEDIKRYKLTLDAPKYFDITARNKFEADVLIESLIEQYEEYFDFEF